MMRLALDPIVCNRALDARDARFDGLFFVGITTTRIYCRPICPARVSYPERRRFFDSAAAAEGAGFRPCLRCRPELAPGCAQVDAVPRLASAAASRIAAGALNGRGVDQLARDLGVGERQLRRAMERELGVSPVELAQTHRLLLAKHLLTDTSLPVTRIAFASGFQSLRRFNTAFRERYRLNPTTMRRRLPRPDGQDAQDGRDGMVRLSLGYRPPLDWEALVATLRAEATPGVEVFEGDRYLRTVGIGGHAGVIALEHDAARAHVTVSISVALLPVLMPLLARLRLLLDLDAEPAVIDRHLAANGLAGLVARRGGVRAPGVFDGFEFAARLLLAEGCDSPARAATLAQEVTWALGEPIASGIPGLDRLGVTAERVAEAGAGALARVGVPAPVGETISALARATSEGTVRLEPGIEPARLVTALTEGTGVSRQSARMIAARALHWPDAFPSAESALLSVVGVSSERALVKLSDRWRPWRAYAAMHLRLAGGAVEPRISDQRSA